MASRGREHCWSSHWEVNSEATVKLITQTFAELKSDSAVGRAEALRRSMRHLMNNGTPLDAHPSVWAPFVLVGKGWGP
jgi:CHAT domain-containing protein